MNDTDLFWSGELRDYLEARIEELRAEVEETSEEHAWQADPEAWAEALVERYSVAIPVLGDVWMEQPEETQVDVSWDHFRRAITDPSTPTYISGYRVTLHVPFEGEPDVFALKPGTYTTVLPDGTVRGNEVTKIIEYPHDAPVDIDGEAKTWVGELPKWLGFAEADVNQFQTELQRHAGQVIRGRKERIAQHRENLAKTTIPVGPPEERGKVSIAEAIVRRPSPAAQLGAERPIELQPALSQEVYEHILEVIRDTGQGMERSLKTYSAMDEEERRDVFATNLNTHYRGRVAAEAFNVEGKTDILVSDEEKKLFIGECKIWSGAKAFSGAVDQLFSYTAWRDTKIALVVFVHEKGLTQVIEKAKEALEAHPQFGSVHGGASETELRAVMSWPGDEERLIDVAVSLFHLPTAN